MDPLVSSTKDLVSQESMHGGSAIEAELHNALTVMVLDLIDCRVDNCHRSLPPQCWKNDRRSDCPDRWDQGILPDAGAVLLVPFAAGKMPTVLRLLACAGGRAASGALEPEYTMGLGSGAWKRVKPTGAVADD